MFSTLLRRISAVLAVCAVIISSSLVFQVSPASAKNVRDFEAYYKGATTGDIVITGNGNLTCAASNPCPAAQNGTETNIKRMNNNYYVMDHIDVDSDPNTFNSSMAMLKMPAGSTVLYAGLFWGGTTSPLSREPQDTKLTPEQLAALPKMMFGTPGGGYQEVNSSRIDKYPDERKDYTAYADVTEIVKAAGPGEYWGANIQARTGRDTYAGWALVVAYENSELPYRDLNVYSGYLRMDRITKSYPITVDGFVTPPAGPVKATIGAVSWEGDAGYANDGMKVNSTKLSDGLSPAGNYFNGTVSERGVLNTDRNPSYVHSMQIDAKTVEVAPGIIPNSATSANVEFFTVGDFYFPIVMTAAIDLYEPKIDPVKEVVNLSGRKTAKRGDILEYRVLVGNAGDANAIDTVFSDTIPLGSEYLPGTLKVTHNADAPTSLTDEAGDDAGEVVGRHVTVRVGEGATAETSGVVKSKNDYLITFQVKVNSDFTGEIVPNTAAVSYVGQDTGSKFSGESNKVETPLVSLTDLTIAKAGPAEVAAGSTISWTLTAGNDGPKAAHDVSITDILPDGLEFISASGTGSTCTHASGMTTCTIPEIAMGATYDVTIKAAVPVDFARTSISNTAKISSAHDDDSNLGNNTATANTAVVQSADLRTEKSATPANVVPGEEFTWTITVTNDGPSNANSVSLSDPMPEGITPISVDDAGCAINGTEVDCDWPLLAPNASKTVAIKAKLASDWTGKAALANTATAASATPDPNPGNNAGSASVTPAAGKADLMITKRTITNPVEAGKRVSYELVVSNKGPSQATDVVIADTLDADLTNISADAVAPTCTVNANNVSCSLATLAVGASEKVTISADLDSDRTENLANTATVSASTADPDLTNNSASVSDPVKTLADLAIVKTAPQAVSGQDVTYTITATNNGPATSRNVSITDTLPKELEYVSSDKTQCVVDATAGTLTCPMGDIANGASASVHVTMHIPADVANLTEIVNTVSVSSDTVDPNKTNNTTTAKIVTHTDADVAITKAGPVSATAGETVSWTLSVTNNGPSIAKNVTVADALPEQIVASPAPTVTTDTGSCTITDGKVNCSLGTLADQGHATITITGTVAADFTGAEIANTATVTSDTADPTPGNNTSSVTTPVKRQADLAITKTLSDEAPVLAGGKISYTLTVTNNGPSQADAVAVNDVLPQGLSNASATSATATCTVNEATVECSQATLATGGKISITITADVASSVTAAIVNTAKVTSSTEDPNNANNSATHTQPVVVKANLAIEKTATEAMAGAQMTYTIKVTNNGPADAANVTIVDQLPKELTFVSASNGNCAVDAGTLKCALGTLGAGNSLSVNVVMDVPSDLAEDTQILNTASATTTTDSDNGEVTDSATSTVKTLADVEIQKLGQPNAVAGQDITWDILVTNLGPSTAREVVFSDVLPEGLQDDVTVKWSAGECSTVGTTIKCQLGDLANGKSAVILIDAKVKSDYQGATMENSASISSATSDPNPANDSSKAVTNIARSADLKVVKSTVTTAVRAGEPITYRLMVSNDGPSQATAVRVSDTVFDHISNVQVTSADSTCEVVGHDVTCTRPTLAAAGHFVIEITGNVDAAYLGSIKNTATVESDTPDPNVDNNSSSVNDEVQADADLAITKVAEKAVAGENITYVMTVVNNGPADAVNATVIDPLPETLTFVSATAGTGQTCTQKAIGLTCELGTMAPGASTTITVVMSIAEGMTPGTKLANTAQVHSETADPDGTNNVATAENTVEASADLVITKSADVTTPAPGENVTWTLQVTNNGPSTARNVAATDAMPAGFTVVSADAPCQVGADSVSVTCNWGKLTSGQSVTVTVQSTLAADYASTEEIVNSASVTSDTPDLDQTNNVGTASLTPSKPVADLVITKRTLTDPVEAGRPLSYEITVENLGPSQASEVAISDVLSADLVNPEAVASVGACDVVDSTLTCNAPTLGVGEKVTVTVNATLASAATGEATNSASVSAASGDPNGDNNTSSVTDPIVAKADLSVVKTASQAVAGEDVTYVLAVTNNGPADAVDVAVVDNLPAELTYVSASDENCQVTTGDTTDVLTCTMDRLANGEVKEITVTMHLPEDLTDPTSVVNTVSVTSPTEDPNEENNSSSATIMTEADADLALTKVGPESVVAGERANWKVTVTNNGPSTAVNAVVVDELPEGVNQEVTVTTDTGECAVADGTITCQLGSLSAKGQAVIDISAMVSPELAAQQITNGASVSSETRDPAPDNNSDQATSEVSTSADLAVVKVGPAKIIAGEQITWTVSVTNKGPSLAQGVTVTDKLPDGVTFAKAEAAGGAQLDCQAKGQEVNCAIAQVKVGQTITFTIQAKSSKGLGNAVIVNHVSVSSVTGEKAETMQDNHGQFSTQIIAPADPPAPKPAPGKMPSTGAVVGGPLAVAAAMLGLGALITTRRRTRLS